MHEKRDRFLAALGRRPLIMGIVNVTPDSFSDGGRFNTHDSALSQAQRLVADGADIIDIGAESTRPGYTPVPEEEELARLRPVLGELVQAIDRPVSIDTYKAAVARQAMQLGAAIVNDIWGLQKDPAMADTVAEGGAAVVVMHNRTEVDPQLDILADLHRFFDNSLARADRAGIPRRHIILDPGIGFGKTKEQNLTALRQLDKLLDYDLPILIGVSRKSIFGQLLNAKVESRLIGTIAANLIAAMRGASIFRVHDAAEHAAAFKVFDAIGRT